MEKKIKQQNSNCIKIVLFGPESTGKTTLAKQLATHYNSLWVPEFSRAYAEQKLKDNKPLTKEDILPIALGQISLENELAKKEKNILFCDTNLLETKIYAEHIYNYCPKEITDSILVSQYHLYILTSTDIPWKYDPVRDSEKEQKKMISVFKNTLEQYKLPFIQVSGNANSRFKTAVKHIDSLLKTTRDTL